MRSTVKRVPRPGDLLRVRGSTASWLPATLASSGLPYFARGPAVGAGDVLLVVGVDPPTPGEGNRTLDVLHPSRGRFFVPWTGRNVEIVA